MKDFRYLGAHLTAQGRKKHTTIERRVERALEQLKLLRFVAASPEAKAKTVRTKIFLALFYGIEVNDITERRLGRIVAAVVDVFAASNENHDTEWLFLFRSQGGDLDTVCQVIVRRCLQLRRSINKRPATQAIVVRIVELYRQQAAQRRVPTDWFRDDVADAGEVVFQNL